MRKKRLIYLCFILCFLFSFLRAAVSISGEKIGILFLSGGFDEEYNFNWRVGYFNHIFPFLPPGFLAGGPFEGETCYTLIHYANEAEATICGVPEGTPIDVFCNEYEGSYPVHSLLNHWPDGDNTFFTDCYPHALPLVVLTYGHSTIDPNTLAVIDGPHIDDPDGAGIGIADFLEMTAFDRLDWHYRMPDYKDPHRKQCLKWWYGNEAPGYPPDTPEMTNVKDALESAMPEYNFAFRHGWESYMENRDPYGNPAFIADSTETAIYELINDEGVDRIIVAPTMGAGDDNLTHWGACWYDKNGQGMSRIPGKTYKECVEDIADNYGPGTHDEVTEYLLNKPWHKQKAPYPEIESLIRAIDPNIPLTFMRNYGEFEDFEMSVFDILQYTVNKYSIPQSASLKIILGHHGFTGGYMDSGECDYYFIMAENLVKRVKTRIQGNFFWIGSWSVVGAVFEFSEAEDDPVSSEKPFGNVLSVGEEIDSAINGRYVNELGQVIDNGDDNYDYIIVIPFYFDAESSDTTYGAREEALGNNIFADIQGQPGYLRDTRDNDGTDYDAGDIDSEHFTVKTFDATGWPSIPGCIEDPDCELHNPQVYKGHATNPTTIIVTGTVLALGNGPARTHLTNAMVNALVEAVNNPDIGGYGDPHCSEPTRVHLKSFEAEAGNHSVTIIWKTASEINNTGFNIYRTERKDGLYNKINDNLIPSHGSLDQGAKYEFVDRGLKNGIEYFYMLEDVDFTGTGKRYGPVSATPRIFYSFLP